MLESPEEGRGAEPWAWPHLRLELPLGTCILSQWRPAATGLGPVLGGLGCRIQGSVFARLGPVGFSGTELMFHLHPWCVFFSVYLDRIATSSDSLRPQQTLFFWLCGLGRCGILVPRSGIEPLPHCSGNAEP